MIGLLSAINGNRKPIGIGAVTGILTAAIGVVMFQLFLSDRFRAEGRTSGAVVMRVEHLESWVADYEKNVRPLRDRFIAFTGELPGLRAQLDRLESKVDALNNRLDRMEARRP